MKDILKQTKSQFISLIKQHKRCAVVRPTGLGKTQLFAEYARDKKSLFVIPRTALEYDIKARFHWLSSSSCTIVTYQKLLSLFKSNTNLGDYFGELDFICLDEMHRAGADKWQDAVKELIEVYNNTEIAGGSATPNRSNGVNIVDEFFDGIKVDSYSLVQAIKDNVLPNPTYVCALYDVGGIFSEIDITKIRDDIDNKDNLVSSIKSKQLEYSKTLNIPSILKKYLSDKYLHLRFMVFFTDIDSLKSKAIEVEQWFKEAFPTKSLKTYITHCYTENNNQSIKEFSLDDNTDIKLLFSVDMLSEGVHIPNTTGVILLRKTNSPILFSQQIGRCLAVGADTPVVFDFVNNIKNTFRFQQYLTKKKYTGEVKNLPVSECQSLYSSINIVDYTLEVEEYISSIERLYNVLNPTLPKESQKEIMSLYLSKVPMKSIEEKLNLSKSVIKRFLIAVGIY